jgi:hypothetical protein
MQTTTTMMSRSYNFVGSTLTNQLHHLLLQHEWNFWKKKKKTTTVTVTLTPSYCCCYYYWDCSTARVGWLWFAMLKHPMVAQQQSHL